jgi:DNA-binding MarR family transcriptional regulator
MCTIQERMLARSSNTTRLIDKLLAKGFVTRETCPVNRRKIEVMITGEGLSLLEKLDDAVAAHERSFGKGMTAEELATLNELLERFRNI